MYPSLKYSKLTPIITLLIGGLSALVNERGSENGYVDLFTEFLYCLAGLALHFIIRLMFKYFQKLQIYFSEKFDFNGIKPEIWFSTEINKIFNNKYGIAFATAITITVSIIIFQTYFAIDGINKILFVLYSSFFFFQVGITAFIFFMLVVFIWKVGLLQIKSQSLIFFHSEAQNINNIYLKFLVFGVILYFFALLIMWFSDGKVFFYHLFKDVSQPNSDYDNFYEMLNLIRIFILCIAVGALGFFILTQKFIHDILKNFKKINLERLNADYISAYQKWCGDKVNDNAEAVNNVLKWIEYTNKQKEWTINLQTVVLFLGSLITPLSKEIIALFK